MFVFKIGVYGYNREQSDRDILLRYDALRAREEPNYRPLICPHRETFVASMDQLFVVEIPIDDAFTIYQTEQMWHEEVLHGEDVFVP